MFFVGQKVICINAACIDTKRKWDDSLIEGRIYRVRWVGEFPLISDRVFGAAIRVYGICRPTSGLFTDYPFLAERFRPLTERKNDGDAFVRALKDACAPAKILEPLK